jgi:hypothetical protein
VTLNVTSGQAVVIYRDTDVTPVATFNDGVSAKAAELNTAFTQCISIAQEAKDAASLQTGGGGTLVGPTGANQYIRSFFNGTSWVWQAISLATLKTDLGVGAGLPALPSTAANIVTVAVGGASYALSTPAQVLTSLGISNQLPPAANSATGMVWSNGTSYAIQSAATARTSLGLTSAAIATIGTAAGNLVALNGSAKIPGSLVDVTTIAQTPRTWVADWTGTSSGANASIPFTSIPTGVPGLSTVPYITSVASAGAASTHGAVLKAGYYLIQLTIRGNGPGSSNTDNLLTYTNAGSDVEVSSVRQSIPLTATLTDYTVSMYLTIAADNTRVRWYCSGTGNSMSYRSIRITQLT